MTNTQFPNNTKEDLRITKTKTALLDAFFKLMSEKTFNEITVNELCDVAGVRRATFYKHFSDKYDFLTKIVQHLRYQFDKKVWSEVSSSMTLDYYIEYIRSLITFLTAHQRAVDMLLHSDARDSLISIIVDQNYKDTIERLAHIECSAGEFEANKEIIACFMAGGVAQAISRWYESDSRCSPEELTEQIIGVLIKLLELCGFNC